jgi:uncharacterized protein YndB with AHSA1/START domain
LNQPRFLVSFQPDPGLIHWRLHLASPPERVFPFLATGDGRARFWAERAVEKDGKIHFIFPGGQTWEGEILASEPPRLFRLVYYGGSLTTFLLRGDGSGGTDLVLTDAGVPPEDRAEVTAGWVSVLMALKASVDFGADLRNHDPARAWDQGYADN